MWLLTHNSITKSAAEWGISNLRRSRVSQAQDSVSFSVPGPFDADHVFNIGDSISISFKHDTTGETFKWFLGRVINIPRAGAPDEESMDYELAGPWWFLDNLVYQQIWATAPRLSPADLDPDEVKLGESSHTDPDTGVITTYDLIGTYKSRVILGQKQDGSRMTSKDVISDVINYAIAAGAPITLGTIEPDLQIPFDEQNDVTCSEVIRRMLRWAPDAITWFDYSTSPYPTFHCARRPALSALSLNIPHISNPTPAGISNLQIVPRDDLVVPAVILKFEQSNSVNGVDYESVFTDKFPTDASSRSFAALTATLQLGGSQANYVTQKIVSTELPVFPAGEQEFWETHDLSFIAGTQESEVIPGSTITHGTPLQYELKEGQIQEWMTEYESSEVTYTAQVRTITKNDAGDTVKEEIRAVSCTIITTDAPSGTYSKLAGLVTGEPVPEGLAKALYDSLNPVQYEGQITLTAQECGLDSDAAAALRAAMGAYLNISGGRAEWTSMNALIQKIDDDVDSGRTTITIGPAEQLSPQDLVERLRANRGRGVAYNFIKRATGESGAGDAVALGGPTPIINTAGASGQAELLIVNKSTKKITLDPTQITATGATEIKTVAVEAIVSGAVKTINILASEPFSMLFPPPPASGDYVLTCQNGVVSWVALMEFSCPEEA